MEKRKQFTMYESINKALIRIREELAAWKDSSQWLDYAGRFIPTASRWLRKRRWEAPPVSGKKQIPTGPSGWLGQAELEAIQKVLREGWLI